LKTIGDPLAVKPLISVLPDPVAYVRAEVVQALRALMPPEEVDKLVDEAQQVRRLNELKAVRKYLSHLAINWWAAQSRYKAE
jgi:HEAT repeat protein